MIDAVRRASRILVLTGAGVSAESGIPTFRDKNGWWKNFRPEDLATPEAFERDPVEVWKWYDLRRGMVAKAEPNPAHLALARAEAAGRRIAIVTQNVDDLHERAGSTGVVHVHGSIWHQRCTVTGTVFEDRRHPLPEIPPRSPAGHTARPNVVWFGEMLDPDVVARAQALARERWDCVMVIGTEATFGYIQQWTLRAKDGGALLVEVNPRETTITAEADVHIPAKAGDAIPDLLG